MRVYQFAPIALHFLRQRPQQIALHLAAQGVTVTYIEPSELSEYFRGERSGAIRGLLAGCGYLLLALAALLNRAVGGRPAELDGDPGDSSKQRLLTLPPVIPHLRINSRLLEKINAAVYREVLRRHVPRRAVGDSENIALVQNPFWGAVLEPNDFSAVYYDAIDELGLFVGKGSMERYRGYERRLLHYAKGVFATAEKIEQRIRAEGYAGPVFRIPNGVDSKWFRERADSGPVPVELRSLRGPVVGYIGMIASWLDYELITAAARGLPAVSFVFVGPVDRKDRADRLHECSNIVLVGRKSYEDVPLYVRHFDACLIPFSLKTDIAHATNPVKLFEYFSLGKPVACTPLHEVRQYERARLVYTGADAGRFVSAVRSAIADHDKRRRFARMKIASEHSWSTYARRMREAFQEGGGS